MHLAYMSLPRALKIFIMYETKKIQRYFQEKFRNSPNFNVFLCPNYNIHSLNYLPLRHLHNTSGAPAPKSSVNSGSPFSIAVLRLPLAHTLQPRQNRRILLQPKRLEQPHGRHTKHIQQIRRRELLTRQPRTLRNAVLQQLQQLPRHGLQPHTNRVRRRQAREAECRVAADAR